MMLRLQTQKSKFVQNKISKLELTFSVTNHAQEVLILKDLSNNLHQLSHPPRGRGLGGLLHKIFTYPKISRFRQF